MQEQIQAMIDSVDYNPETGEFFTKKSRGNIAAGTKIGSIDGKAKKYLRSMICGKHYLLHRVAWLISHGKWPDGDIDHINGDSLDNRLCNLRDVPENINVQNIRSAYRSNKSGYLGVCWHKQSQKYRATVKHDNKLYHCGSFDDPEKAHEAYLQMKRKLHDGCTI